MRKSGGRILLFDEYSRVMSLTWNANTAVCKLRWLTFWGDRRYPISSSDNTVAIVSPCQAENISWKYVHTYIHLIIFFNRWYSYLKTRNHLYYACKAIPSDDQAKHGTRVPAALVTDLIVKQIFQHNTLRLRQNCQHFLTMRQAIIWPNDG